MEKEIRVVKEELSKLFEVDKNIKLGTHIFDCALGVKFNISKKQMERHDVINKLQEYFSDGTTIKNGYLKVGSITFVHTDFDIVVGKPY